MPIYEYECEKCHQKEEVLQRLDEAAPEICEHCGAKNSLKKAVALSSFHLKGGGWYKDLYASPKPSASGEQKTEKADNSGGQEKTKKNEDKS